MLLILGGGLLASVLAALIFTPKSVGEDKQTREMRKLMTALEAQRRIRDAQQARELRQRGAAGHPLAMRAQASAAATEEPTPRYEEAIPMRALDPAPAPVEKPPPPRPEKANPTRALEAVPSPAVDQRSAERERKAAAAAEQAERRAVEQQQRREEKERAAARKAALDAERKAQRQAERERKAALAAEQGERRAAEQQLKREENEHTAARKAALAAEKRARHQEQEHTAPLHSEHHETHAPAPTPTPTAVEPPTRPLTASAQRDLDEIARWREEDDRRAAAKAMRSKRRASVLGYTRRQDASVAAQKPEQEDGPEPEEDHRDAERAAAIESQRKADEEARRRAEEEREQVLEAERAARLAAEQRAKDEEAIPVPPWTVDPDHMAALNAERHELELKREELRSAAREDATDAEEAPDEKPSRLSDLPLYTWANANEDEDEPPAEPD